MPAAGMTKSPASQTVHAVSVIASLVGFNDVLLLKQYLVPVDAGRVRCQRRRWLVMPQDPSSPAGHLAVGSACHRIAMHCGKPDP
jgi:hypothetical protein